ncbi:ribonuclease H-like domain-containing protein [Leptospira sp. GIMC2001]|uniref:ribonuclease H-like domain-containing protein n=1 Tax=Leptospira sp. GIMC2001 TaxID=1513297 RepID=UPI002349D26C|nr:ribonuclease H-like domain-containing protein [Leptospira sp. GIMC2001]WCL48631.1 ribonuclease H-like domain-containing protein [Leptospira sp. GIMC2001]
MIRNSFIHLTGVDTRIEKFLWNQGIFNWDNLRNNLSVLRSEMSPVFFEEELPMEMDEADKALDEHNARYFFDRYPYAESWRIFGELKNEFLYLDIETTGLYDPNFVTCVCIYEANQIHQFTRTKNLDNFYDFWEGRENKILVTYNGFKFDVPFLERSMKWKNTNRHMDLMHVLHKMGIKGGLKGTEEQLGIRRSDDLIGVNGYAAVQLWNSYIETDIDDYLHKLIKYNQEDTINLAKILGIVYNRKRAEIFPLPDAGLF